MKRTIFRPPGERQPISKPHHATRHGTPTPRALHILPKCKLLAAALLLSKSALVWLTYKCVQALVAYCVWLVDFDLSKPMAYIMFVLSIVFLLVALGTERALTLWDAA